MSGRHRHVSGGTGYPFARNFHPLRRSQIERTLKQFIGQAVGDNRWLPVQVAIKGAEFPMVVGGDGMAGMGVVGGQEMVDEVPLVLECSEPFHGHAQTLVGFLTFL
jgi:hypothetical protein